MSTRRVSRIWDVKLGPNPGKISGHSSLLHVTHCSVSDTPPQTVNRRSSNLPQSLAFVNCHTSREQPLCCYLTFHVGVTLTCYAISIKTTQSGYGEGPGRLPSMHRGEVKERPGTP